ncbi:DUF192 domain-containing protein [Aestuariibacter sp. A3R04]|nr:DUF192 domain-containing protein [Aestuariibacter sp. A3R04]
MVLRNLLLLLCVVLAACQTAAQEPVEFESATIIIGGKTLPVAFAKTPEQRARGLMFRKALCEDCGMLFQFLPERQASMWMKNTFIPLDVAFIDRNGVITDIKPLTPHDLTSVGASKAVMFALEMNQGWFAANNVRVGDHINVKM